MASREEIPLPARPAGNPPTATGRLGSHRRDRSRPRTRTGASITAGASSSSRFNSDAIQKAMLDSPMKPRATRTRYTTSTVGVNPAALIATAKAITAIQTEAINIASMPLWFNWSRTLVLQSIHEVVFPDSYYGIAAIRESNADFLSLPSALSYPSAGFSPFRQWRPQWMAGSCEHQIGRIGATAGKWGWKM